MRQAAVLARVLVVGARHLGVADRATDDQGDERHMVLTRHVVTDFGRELNLAAPPPTTVLVGEVRRVHEEKVRVPRVKRPRVVVVSGHFVQEGASSGDIVTFGPRAFALPTTHL